MSANGFMRVEFITTQTISLHDEFWTYSRFVSYLLLIESEELHISAKLTFLK